MPILCAYYRKKWIKVRVVCLKEEREDTEFQTKWNKENKKMRGNLGSTSGCISVCYKYVYTVPTR